MKRAVTAMVVAGAAWMGLASEAQAQVLITPTGPLAIKTRIVQASPAISELTTDRNKVYPGRTMGGGTRILRSSPPPSSLKRREE